MLDFAAGQVDFPVGKARGHIVQVGGQAQGIRHDAEGQAREVEAHMICGRAPVDEHHVSGLNEAASALGDGGLCVRMLNFAQIEGHVSLFAGDSDTAANALDGAAVSQFIKVAADGRAARLGRLHRPLLIEQAELTGKGKQALMPFGFLHS